MLNISTFSSKIIRFIRSQYCNGLISIKNSRSYTFLNIISRVCNIIITSRINLHCQANLSIPCHSTIPVAVWFTRSITSRSSIVGRHRTTSGICSNHNLRVKVPTSLTSRFRHGFFTRCFSCSQQSGRNNIILSCHSRQTSSSCAHKFHNNDFVINSEAKSIEMLNISRKIIATFSSNKWRSPFTCWKVTPYIIII